MHSSREVRYTLDDIHASNEQQQVSTQHSLWITPPLAHLENVDPLNRHLPSCSGLCRSLPRRRACEAPLRTLPLHQPLWQMHHDTTETLVTAYFAVQTVHTSGCETCSRGRQLHNAGRRSSSRTHGSNGGRRPRCNSNACIPDWKTYCLTEAALTHTARNGHC